MPTVEDKVVDMLKHAACVMQYVWVLEGNRRNGSSKVGLFRVRLCLHPHQQHSPGCCCRFDRLRSTAPGMVHADGVQTHYWVFVKESVDVIPRGHVHRPESVKDRGLPYETQVALLQPKKP